MKRVILTPNPYRDKNFQTVRRSADILRSAGVEPRICLPFDVDRNYELPKDLHFSKLEKELPSADAVICFGGDGTILHSARLATRHSLPVLGVNIGTMGFMAELECGELEELARLAGDDFEIDSRMMLDITVNRGRDIVFHETCLNDVVFTKGAVARIVHLNVACDGVQAMECGGDGIIVSTPTGSTAYNLSAGGPIVEPEAKSILVTPICAHDMGSRCMIASDKRTISVQLTKNAKRNAYLSVDGGKAFRMNIGDVATIHKADKEVKLIRIKKRSFYDVVNAKFHNNSVR